LYTFVVIKAERISDDDIDEGYMFPDDNDDLTEYNGGTIQLMVSSDLLQDISKHFIITPTITQCLLIIRCTTRSKLM